MQPQRKLEQESDFWQILKLFVATWTYSTRRH